MFNKIVFEARISRFGEDPRKINDTGTHIGHFPLGCGIHILDMHCEEATRPSFEIGQWIPAGLRDPVQVKLELHERGIGFGKQHIVWNLAFNWNELKVVVVIAQLKPGLPSSFAGAVQQVRKFMPVAHRV